MFRLAFISTLLVISIVNLWALNCKECMGEGPDGDKKDCWEGKDGVDQGKRDTSFFFNFVPHCFICFYSAHTYIKEIKITIGDDVLSSSWFCVVNLHLGKFGLHPGGS